MVQFRGGICTLEGLAGLKQGLNRKDYLGGDERSALVLALAVG